VLPLLFAYWVAFSQDEAKRQYYLTSRETVIAMMFSSFS
jgi:hypothetical protein